MAELNENIIEHNKDVKGGRSDRYIFNVSFIAYFIMIVALALLRVIIYFGAFDWAGDDGIDLIFTFISQIVILAGGSLVLITCFFKKGFKGALDYLQVKKPKPYIFLAFIIGFFGFFANMIINIISSLIFTALGWHTSSGAETVYPVWMFFVSVLFTAVFPGICEEIAHRGLVLKAAKAGGASDAKAILISGLLFGLFHMYIGQTVFTFIMGCVMALMTVKSKSIIPAFIMHFTNNFMSVCLNFASQYYPIFDVLDSNLGLFGLFILFCIISIPVLILLLVLFVRRARKAGDCPPKKQFVYQPPYVPYMPYGQGNPFSSYPQPFQPAAPQYMKPQSQQFLGGAPVQPENQTAGWPYAAQQPYNPYMQAPNPYAFNPYAPPVAPPVQSEPPKAAGFKPSFRDKIFYYATIIFAAMITIISFISGL